MVVQKGSKFFVFSYAHRVKHEAKNYIKSKCLYTKAILLYCDTREIIRACTYQCKSHQEHCMARDKISIYTAK